MKKLSEQRKGKERKGERERERDREGGRGQTDRQTAKEGERLCQAAHMILVILPQLGGVLFLPVV